MTVAVALLAAGLAAVNGANDVAKGVATLAGSRSCRYRVAVSYGAVTTLVGSVAAVSGVHHACDPVAGQRLLDLFFLESAPAS